MKLNMNEIYETHTKKMHMTKKQMEISAYRDQSTSIWHAARPAQHQQHGSKTLYQKKKISNQQYQQ